MATNATQSFPTNATQSFPTNATQSFPTNATQEFDGFTREDFSSWDRTLRLFAPARLFDLTLILCGALFFVHTFLDWWGRRSTQRRLRRAREEAEAKGDDFPLLKFLVVFVFLVVGYEYRGCYACAATDFLEKRKKVLAYDAEMLSKILASCAALGLTVFYARWRGMADLEQHLSKFKAKK